jgi:O-antigen ligase
MDVDVSRSNILLGNRSGGVLLTPNDSLINGIWPRSIPLWFVIFYVLLFIIRPWEKLIPELAPLHFERWFAITMILTVIISGRMRLRFDFQSVSVLLFALAMGLSGLTADIPVRTWFVPYEYLTLVVIYFILASAIHTSYELLFVIASYVAIMTLYLAKSQWEFFVYGAGRYEMGVLRLQGLDLTFGNDNALSASVNYSLPFLFVLFLIRKDFTASWPWMWRNLFLPSLVFYTVLAVTSVFLTNSRTGAVGLMLCTVLLATRGKNLGGKVLAAIAAGVLGVIVIAVLPTEIQGRIRTLWDPDSGPENARASAEGRWIGFQAGIKMFEDHPVTGVGVDNFRPYRVSYVDGVDFAAHNLIGELLGETGLLGGVAFSLLVIATLINSNKALRLAKHEHGQTVPWMMSEVALSCRAVVLLLFFHGLSGHNLERFNWLWAGAFCALSVRFIVVALNQNWPYQQETHFIPR